MNVLSILNEIAATASSKEKEAIIRREKDNESLRATFAAAYNPLVNYYVRQIPDYVAGKCSPQLTLTQAIAALSDLSSRKVTGNAASNTLGWILTNCSVDDAVVIERIIARDLRCGCSDTIASRIWSGLVPVFDVMLCGNDMSRIKYPAIAQLKCDGARVHLYFDGNEAKAMSRGGKEFQLLGALNEAASKVMKPGECWDGELLVINNGKVADRQTGNGILNKASKGTISQAEADMIVMVVWDIVDFGSTIPYVKRFGDLQTRLEVKSQDKIGLVPSMVVSNEDEALQFFQEQLADGQEGAILKNMDSKWVPKRSKDLCKLKEIQSADLIVIDSFEGTGKYEGMLGGLTCETADGKLQVNIGSGFSDAQRHDFWNKDMRGQIVEVLYNQVIQSKGRDQASLFLPRFSLVRFDKNVANTFDELV